MLKRVLAVLLCGLLLETMLAADAWALRPNDPVPSKSSVKVRNAVQRLGIGQHALVAVRLQDQSVVSGWLSSVGPESFELVDAKTALPVQVRFGDVTRLAGMNIMSGDSVQYGGGIRSKLAKLATVLVPARRPAANGFAGTTLLIVGIVLGVLIAIIVAKTL